mmetsp:Transcript_18055/g.23063  ORF Transcript_18055/g.23063 Transcript_18055/m.23063 type:complete len:160 (-) Transcript_18055:176-655(-)
MYFKIIFEYEYKCWRLTHIMTSPLCNLWLLNVIRSAMTASCFLYITLNLFGLAAAHPVVSINSRDHLSVNFNKHCALFASVSIKGIPPYPYNCSPISTSAYRSSRCWRKFHEQWRLNGSSIEMLCSDINGFEKKKESMVLDEQGTTGTLWSASVSFDWT